VFHGLFLSSPDWLKFILIKIGIKAKIIIAIFGIIQVFLETYIANHLLIVYNQRYYRIESY